MRKSNDYKFEDKQIIKQMVYEYEINKKSLRVVAKQFHVNVVKLSAKLKELGINTSNSHRCKRYSHDKDYFEIINSHEKAYWLGLMMADGCVYSTNGADVFQLYLNEQDLETIENFKKVLNATNPIFKTSKKYESGNITSTYGIAIRSNKTCSDLIDKGVVKRKSLIKQFPSSEKVPEEFIYSYIRGYMDGNGSLRVITCKTQENSIYLRFSTSEKFAKSLQTIVGGRYKKDSSGRNAWELSLNKNETENILQKIYKDSTPETRMKRKYEKYLYKK